MKTVIVGASKPSRFKIGAWLIMWWEETTASHCYTKLNVGPDTFVYFQAVGSGTEFCGKDYFLDKNDVVLEKYISVSEEKYDLLVSKAVQKLKQKYSVLHLAGLFYKRLIQYVTKGKIIVKNPFKDSGKSAVCVQALCMIIDSTDVVRKAEDPDDMGMYEAMQMLKEIPIG